MDPENNREVSDMPATPQQEEVAVTQPAAAEGDGEEKQQPAGNGAGDAVGSNTTPVQDDSPLENPEAKPPVPVAVPEEPHPVSDPVSEAEIMVPPTQEDAAPQQPEELPPCSTEKVQEKVLDEVEAVVEAQEVVKEAQAQNDGEKIEGSTEKPAATSTEKPTETSMQEKALKKAEAEMAPPAEPKKESEPDTSSKLAVPPGAEASDPAPEKEPALPSAGSLSFPILKHEKTKDALCRSRTLVVIKGLPGSGKTFLSRALADAYKDHCSVFCADDYADSADPAMDAHKALDEAVVACCADTTMVMVVVDDTNHTHERLARLGELAREQQMVAVFLTPRTEWSADMARLAKLSGRKPAAITAMKRQLDEVCLPLFFGWFLLTPAQDQLRSTGSDFLTALDGFKKNAVGSSVNEGQEIPLEQYFKGKRSLHCTTKFCDYGKAEGAKEYAEKPEVSELYGSVFDLAVSALFVTPRTFGARVSLTDEQLVLWPADAEKEAESSVPGAASLPLGSRAHITLGCADGVEPVQTGLDLLEILVLPEVEPVTDLELGSLRFYGEGRWMLKLKEPMCAAACFSSFYKRPSHEKGKRDPKKKKNCAIL